MLGWLPPRSPIAYRRGFAPVRDFAGGAAPADTPELLGVTRPRGGLWKQGVPYGGRTGVCGQQLGRHQDTD